MKTLLLAALLSPAYAVDPAPAVEGPFLRTSTVRVDACYERPDHPEADRLGLPKVLCLDTVSMTVSERAPSPFGIDSFMSVTGAPSAPKMHIGGGAREKDGWEVVGSWWSKRAAKPECGRLNGAHASVYVRSTDDGVLKEGPVLVRAFLMDGSALCPNYARAVHFDYKRL